MVYLYELEEHNQAFDAWQRARCEGYINKPLDLFHIDAHSDMGKPRIFKKSLYPARNSARDYLKYYQDFSRKELDLGNFIFPAVLSGLVKDIHFIYPRWRKIRPWQERGNLGSLFGEGRILRYDVKNKPNANPELIKGALPDLKYYRYYAQTIDKIPRSRQVILDIDLDYFAARDTVLNRLGYELEITREQFFNRKEILKDKTLPISRLDFIFQRKGKKYYVRIAHKKVEDRAYLPCRKEIQKEIDYLLSQLKRKNTKPALITLCKSSISGYCPDTYREFIENKVKAGLSSLLNFKTITL